MYFPFFFFFFFLGGGGGGLCSSLFCEALPYVFSSFAIFFTRAGCFALSVLMNDIVLL